MAERDNVEWMIGEYLLDPNVSDRVAFCQTGLDKIEQAAVREIGLAFGGWTGEDGPVKGTPLENIIRDWWSEF